VPLPFRARGRCVTRGVGRRSDRWRSPAVLGADDGRRTGRSSRTREMCTAAPRPSASGCSRRRRWRDHVQA
jgi:hypothetical protein